MEKSENKNIKKSSKAGTLETWSTAKYFQQNAKKESKVHQTKQPTLKFSPWVKQLMILNVFEVIVFEFQFSVATLD